jgi:MFS family permease
VIVIAGLAVLLISGKNLVLLTTGAVLFGIGLSASAIEPPLLVRQVFGSKDYSTIFSYVMMALNLMVGVGVSVFGFMYDILGSYGPAIMVVIVSYAVVLLAIILSISLGRKLQEE